MGPPALRPHNVIYQHPALQDEGITLELSKLSTYREVCEALADALQLDNPAKLRLTQHNNFSGTRPGLKLPCLLSRYGLCLSDSMIISIPPPAGISAALLGLRSWAGAQPQQALLCRQMQDSLPSACAAIWHTSGCSRSWAAAQPSNASLCRALQASPSRCP